MTKTVRIYGRTFTVFGSEGDDYFNGLPDGADLTDSVLAAIRPHVAPDSVCLDVGANIGLYSLGLGALVPNGQVHAFEPSPSAYEHLERNLAANRSANVTASNVAVGDSNGTAEFHDFPFFTAGSFSAGDGGLLSAESYGSTSFRVAKTAIDDYMVEHGLNRVDLLKIDVEGGELSVLAGAAKTLAAHRPVTVLEFNTFAFTIHQGLLPQVALARIMGLFPHVFVLDREDGSLARLATEHETYRFLYDNGIHGPTDNLLCTFGDLPVTRRFSPTLGQGPSGPGWEVEAMRRTLSWRITAPLRRARVRLDPVLARAAGLRRRLMR